MLYLVGGASRAGKTILATRLLTHYGVSWFSLDALRMGLFRGASVLALDPERDDLEEADRLWPIVREIATNLFKYNQDYCFEGVCLRPEQAANFREMFPGRVKACFLVYPNANPDQMVKLVRTHRGGPNDWLSGYDDEAIKSFVDAGIKRSAALQKSCERAGISFFDTGDDFDNGIREAEKFLVRRI